MSMTPSRRQIESYHLKHAAEDGRLFFVKCSICRKTDVYAARDLVTVWRPEAPVVSLFETCRHCGSGEWVSMRMRLPTSDDVGHLRIRRPAGIKKIQLWEDAWYG